MEKEPSLLDFCPSEYRERVEAGEIELLPGQKPDKPVVRYAVGPKKGQLLPGSGRFPRANDIAAVSRATAYKRTGTYQEAMSLMMDVDAPPTKRGSFAWWYEQAMVAAEGSPTKVSVPCSHDECFNKEHETVVTVNKKDGNLIFRLLELKHGKAKETKEIDINQKTMIDLMETRQVVVQVYGMDSAEVESRREFLGGLIEGQFTEVDEDDEGSAGSSVEPA